MKTYYTVTTRDVRGSFMLSFARLSGAIHYAKRERANGAFSAMIACEAY